MNPPDRQPDNQEARPPDVETTADPDLVATAQAGDYGSFEELVRRHSQNVYGICAGYFRRQSDIEDAVQDTFLSAYRALPRFRQDAKFGTWVYRIAVNACLMILRKRKNVREVPIDADPHDDESIQPAYAVTDQTPDDDLKARELREQILAAMDTLEEKYRTVFVLRDIRGMSIAETADVLEMSPAAVKSRLHRARLSMRASLERYLNP